MSEKAEIIVSARDAEDLSRTIADHSAAESQAAEALQEKLVLAKVVDDERLPPDRAALGSTVVYEEAPGGTQRRVTLALPEGSDAASGKVSVLSPVGCALLGHRVGDDVEVELPGRPQLTLHISETEPRTAG